MEFLDPRCSKVPNNLDLSYYVEWLLAYFPQETQLDDWDSDDPHVKMLFVPVRGSIPFLGIKPVVHSNGLNLIWVAFVCVCYGSSVQYVWFRFIEHCSGTNPRMLRGLHCTMLLHLPLFGPSWSSLLTLNGFVFPAKVWRTLPLPVPRPWLCLFDTMQLLAGKLICWPYHLAEDLARTYGMF